MSSIATFALTSQRDSLRKIRGAPIRKNQHHRNRYHEFKSGERKHKGDWS
jgi:hypothetical protein